MGQLNIWFLQHIERTFHDVSGKVVEHDSGLLQLAFDRNKMRYVEDKLPGLKQAEKASCRLDRPYCGWPYYFALITMMRSAMHWSGQKQKKGIYFLLLWALPPSKANF